MNTARFITLGLVGLLAFVILASLYMWWQLEDVEIGVKGTVAIILGALVTFATWAGLMRLIYYSHSRGHDDNVG